MSILRFNEAQLTERLEQLSQQGRVAFAAACAERLFPAYGRFSALTGRGRPDDLERILSRVWSDLAGDRMSDAEVNTMIKFCTELIPNEDDRPWVMEQAAAEDAAAALAYALDCRHSGRANEAAWAARRAYEALDHYVINHAKIDTNVAGGEERVLAHPLIQAELARQERDLDELLHGTVATDQLRERAKMEARIFFHELQQ